ncbi:MAG: Gfo/Idh/MocA family oxidoreductase [Fimbriimonadaceae bacterium]
MHAHGFTAALKADDRAHIVGIWDDDAERGRAFAEKHGILFFDEADALFCKIGAAVICSENMKHADHIEWAAKHNLHILCEKPIAPNREHWDRISAATEDLDRVKMTAFPCPFSPTFQSLNQKVRNEDLGRILAINGTNQGKCPFGWFVDPAQSGGGAMIDHTVHVVDLMRRLLCCEPEQVQAQVGNKMYGESWERFRDGHHSL